jgi:hypothetical protein
VIRTELSTLKDRTYTTAPLKSEPPSKPSGPQSSKRKAEDYSNRNTRKKKRTEDEVLDDNIDEDEESGSGVDIDCYNTVGANKFSGFDLEVEEEKPKPILQVQYQGYNISGHCLCVVAEPWPPLRAATRRLQTAPIFHGSANVALRSKETVRSEIPREQTPLFLPDDDEREMSVIAPDPPGPSSDSSMLDELMAFDDDDDDGGMMAFSQILASGDDFRAGALADDDDIEGAVFFGDADEVREL